jgi:hypothetical protein
MRPLSYTFEDRDAKKMYEIINVVHAYYSMRVLTAGKHLNKGTEFSFYFHCFPIPNVNKTVKIKSDPKP